SNIDSYRRELEIAFCPGSYNPINWSKGNMGSKKVIEIWWVRIGYFLKIGLKF
ncbi:unnamed protein product, partial [marine sediment metagenome]